MRISSISFFCVCLLMVAFLCPSPAYAQYYNFGAYWQAADTQGPISISSTADDGYMDGGTSSAYGIGYWPEGNGALGSFLLGEYLNAKQYLYLRFQLSTPLSAPVVPALSRAVLWMLRGM